MKNKVLISIIALILAGIGWLMFRLYGPSPQIVVSKQTTWLTEPLAEGGFPDFARWILDREGEGVTPKNNAAIPLLTAMWNDDLFRPNAKLVWQELGAPVPISNEGFSAIDNWNEEEGLGYQLYRHYLLRDGVGEDSSELSFEQYLHWLSLGEMGSDMMAMNAEVYGEVEPEEEKYVRAISLSEKPRDLIYEQPWSRKQFPPLADWVDRYAASFDLLHEAARREKYYCPSVTYLNTPKCSFLELLQEDIHKFHSVVRILSTRAMMSLGEHDSAAAWRDVQAIHRIAERIPDRSLVDQFVRMAMHNIAQSSAHRILANEPVDLATAKAIHNYYGNETLEFDFAKSFDEAERLSFITTVLSISGQWEGAESGWDTIDLYDMTDSINVTGFAVDWNIVLRYGNVWFDRLAEIGRLEEQDERQVAMDEFEADMQSLNAMLSSPEKNINSIVSREGRSERMGEMLISLFLAGVDSVYSSSDRAFARRQLLHIAAALTVYHGEHGTYPESLEPLVPELLPRLPVDGFTGAPIAYTRTKSGYLLVNIGLNGLSDGGSNWHEDIYKGLEMGDDEDRFIALFEILGEPVPRDLDGDVDWSMDRKMTIDADDIAWRVPQPKMKWPEGASAE